MHFKATLKYVVVRGLTSGLQLNRLGEGRGCIIMRIRCVRFIDCRGVLQYPYTHLILVGNIKTIYMTVTHRYGGRV